MTPNTSTSTSNGNGKSNSIALEEKLMQEKLQARAWEVPRIFPGSVMTANGNQTSLRMVFRYGSDETLGHMTISGNGVTIRTMLNKEKLRMYLSRGIRSFYGYPVSLKDCDLHLLDILPPVSEWQNDAKRVPYNGRMRWPVVGQMEVVLTRSGMQAVALKLDDAFDIDEMSLSTMQDMVILTFRNEARNAQANPRNQYRRPTQVSHEAAAKRAIDMVAEQPAAPEAAPKAATPKAAAPKAATPKAAAPKAAAPDTAVPVTEHEPYDADDILLSVLNSGQELGKAVFTPRSRRRE